VKSTANKEFMEYCLIVGHFPVTSVLYLFGGGKYAFLSAQTDEMRPFIRTLEEAMVFKILFILIVAIILPIFTNAGSILSRKLFLSSES